MRNATRFKVDNSSLFLVFIWFLYLMICRSSSGYYQADEHYQIIEFANYKLGLLPEKRLAWEFDAQIRSGFQPLICYILLKAFNLLAVNDGYTIAFLLRVVSATFSIAVIYYFVNAYKKTIREDLRTWFFYLSFTLWFIPYINIRFSSETWSGFFLLLAIGFIQNSKLKESITKYFVLGLLLGIAILFRYQSTLVALGILAWYVIIIRVTFKKLIVLLLSITFVLILGLIVDWWLYGEFVLTIYNYFYVNIVNDVASTFGTSPWYTIVIYILQAPGPIGLIILISGLIIMCRKPKSIIIWAMIPFLVIHSFIPHKELRFIFPLANFVPILIIYALQTLTLDHKVASTTPESWNSLLKYTTMILIFINSGVGLAVILSTGAGRENIVVSEYIHKSYDIKRLNIILYKEAQPYMDWGPPKNSYYNSEGLKIAKISLLNEYFLSKYIDKSRINLLIVYDSDLPTNNSLELMGFKKVYKNIPDFVNYVYKFYNPSLCNLAMSVYQLH